MSDGSDAPRPSFRFRDKFSRMKERFKDKLKDKAIKHNITRFVQHNFTSDDLHGEYTTTPRHGFRQHMHHYKDVLKNKTHYESIKHRIKDKIDDKLDLHDNKTYSKGFYDSLFSPETENDAYLQTALVSLWVIALLCIIPTIVVIFLPARKKTRSTTSTNMIFFHVFLCELCYLTYVLLAMINVAKDFRMGPLLCDIANYGMYVTIPIMQFALLFLSLERLSKHFNLSLTWTTIFTKPYLIQVILCVIWIVLIALLVTFMFIRKQFTFNFIKDKAASLAPPIFGDVMGRLAARRHHCSIDGRLSSVFKVVIIILFVLLIVKPILFSLGFNLLSPVCCRGRRKDSEKRGDRRTTTLVTIFLVLNVLFSFPFYIVSMFNSVLTRIDSTKDTFALVLKICFILRITNIIFECLAFYIFEPNSWNWLSKLLYYCTCKKCPIFNASPDDETMYTKDPDVQNFINRTRLPSKDEDDDDDDDDDDGDDGGPRKKKRIVKKKSKKIVESEPDDDDDDDDEEVTTRKRIVKKKSEEVVESESEDDDGSFRKPKRKQSKVVEEETVEDSDDDEAKPTIKRTKKITKKVVETDDDDDDDDDEEEEQQPTKISSKARHSHSKKVQIEEEEDDDDDDEEKQTTKRLTGSGKRKSRVAKPASDEDEEDARPTKSKSRTKRLSRADDDDENEEEPPAAKPKRRSHVKLEVEEETTRKPKTHTRTKKPKSTDVDVRVPSRKSSSTGHAQNQTKRPITRAPSPPARSDADPSPVRVSKPTRTKPSATSTEAKRTRAASPKRSHHRPDPSPSGRTKTKKRAKKDHHTRILEMSHEV